MNSKYLPIFAQSSPITIKWLLLNRLRARQFLVNTKLPKPDHPGTGKHGILGPKSIIFRCSCRINSLKNRQPKLPVSLNRKLHPG